MNNIDIYPTSENSVLITWPEKICPVQHQQILNTSDKINNQFKSLIFETVVSYNSIMIYYHFDKVTFHQLEQHINDCIIQVNSEDMNSQSDTLVTEIPVYYGEDAGWDLQTVAQQCQLSTEEVIQLHCQQIYRAYALGFTPGFCYLGSINQKLILPRKATPRLKVPKGAVAIAEQQAAVYPNISPGGWHIIGQTPLALYQKSNENFVPLIQVGQQIKFTEIDKETYMNLAGTLPVIEGKI